VKRVLFILAVALGVAVPANADVYSLLDFNSAVDALYAVDPTIDPPPNDPSKDFAVGGFTGVDNNKVGFSAHYTSSGQHPQGYVTETIPGSSSEAPIQERFRVVCLAVVGHNAAIGLVPAENQANDETRNFILAVRDGGPGGTADMYLPISEVDPTTCGDHVPDAFFLVVEGNILVNDGALP
jgi:hypothetical protein